MAIKTRFNKNNASSKHFESRNKLPIPFDRCLVLKGNEILRSSKQEIFNYQSARIRRLIRTSLYIFKDKLGHKKKTTVITKNNSNERSNNSKENSINK